MEKEVKNTEIKSHTIFLVHLIDLATIPPDKNPVKPCFIEVVGRGNLRAREARQGMKR